MFIQFTQQDVIDSVCVWMVNNNFANDPSEVDAELHFNVHFDDALSATAEGIFDNAVLSERDIQNGIAMYLEDFHCFDPSRIAIQLNFDPQNGVSAQIETNV